jgi:deferrochelatase/peroxidase EfeB
VGRWPSGAPILKSPNADNPALGENPLVNNDFEFGGDREGVTCPWAAHIRKAYPRDDVRGEINLDPKKDEARIDAEEARTQSHRMLRRGIQFGPELTEDEKKADSTIEQRGLIFKCYVTSIEDQFEFVQRFWVNNPGFVQEGSGMDAIIGQAQNGGARPFAGAGKVGAKPQASFAQWVKMTGGEYFFAPSIDFLSNLR